MPRTNHVHRTLKKFFIPHRANKYHPHILHTKHIARVGLGFLALKIVVVVIALLIPASAFVAPDVLAEQGSQLLALTNQLRVEKGLSPLHRVGSLTQSAQFRADDMGEKQYFSHLSPDGHRLSYFLSRAGYRYSAAGENLAMGFSDAHSVMAAWMKSPTHYENLIDPEYQDLGIGLDGGMYDGKPTVFIAQHFGLAQVIPPPEAVPAKPPAVIKHPHPDPVIPTTTTNGVIAFANIPKQQQTIARASAVFATTTNAMVTTTAPLIATESAPPDPYNPHDSFVAWQELPDHRTQLQAKLSVPAHVQLASVHVDGYTIDLHPTAGTTTYTGALTVAESPEEVFKTIIPPTVDLLRTDTTRVQGPIDWKDPKIVSQTPWERYLQTKSWFYHSIPVFVIAKYLYLAGIIFFAAALLLSIIVEIRRQHPHVIAQTAALLVLLVLFWKF